MLCKYKCYLFYLKYFLLIKDRNKDKSSIDSGKTVWDRIPRNTERDRIHNEFVVPPARLTRIEKFGISVFSIQSTTNNGNFNIITLHFYTDYFYISLNIIDSVTVYVLKHMTIKLIITIYTNHILYCSAS